MSWNEPNGGGSPKGEKPKDPWGNNGRKTPPDLDALLRKWFDKIHALLGGKNLGSSGPTKNGELGPQMALMILGGLLILWLLSGVYRVEQAEQVVVTRFGKFYTIVGPGLQWRPRFIDSIVKVNTERVHTHSHQATILTRDKNIVDVQVGVQYRVSNPRSFVLSIQDALGILTQATESALRHVVGGSDMGSVITEGRQAIAQEVRQKIQHYLDTYSSGLAITKVNIEDAHPPNEVKAAFDDVIKAKEDEERLQNEAQAYANGMVPEARGHAVRQREEAEAYKQEVIARAEGEASRFSRLLVEYKRAPEVTRQRLYLETMESIFSKTSKVVVSAKGNNLLYLPLDKIMQATVSEKTTPPVVDKPAASLVTPEPPPNVIRNRFGREDR